MKNNQSEKSVLSWKAQHGVTIVVVLIVLMLMSLLGVAAAKVAMLSSQSTRYQRDYRVAYESAQAALTDAIMDIESGSRKDMFFAGNEAQFPANCGNNGNTKGLCLYEEDPQETPEIYAVDFANSDKVVPYGAFTGRSFASGATGLKPVKLPRYIIERREDTVGLYANPVSGHYIPRPPIYRITAMGFGPSESVYAVIQADYRKAN